MTVGFHDATIADLPNIDRIFRTSFCDTFAHLYRPEDLETFLAKFTPQAWRAEMDDPACVFRIAEANGEPAGFVKIGPLTLPVEPSGKALELRQLYVLEDHQGSGIAAQLMEWVLDKARGSGATGIYLTVYTGNHRARRFYERHGFEAVGRYDFMVGNQADEDVIMRKLL